MLNAFFRPPLPAVSSIKKQHLVEVRTMANPPGAVKLALESICLLLGEETNDWKKIRPVILRDNFISSIVNFNIEEMRYLGFLKFLTSHGDGISGSLGATDFYMQFLKLFVSLLPPLPAMPYGTR